MHVRFVKRNDMPARMVAEAEVFFDADGPLHGLKLVGFSIWRSSDQTERLYITFPARAFGAGSERRYFDFVRPQDPMDSPEGRTATWRLKDWIMKEYRTAQESTP